MTAENWWPLPITNEAFTQVAEFVAEIAAASNELIGNRFLRFGLKRHSKHHTLISIALLEAAGQGIFNEAFALSRFFMAGATMPLSIKEAGNLVNSAIRSPC